VRCAVLRAGELGCIRGAGSAKVVVAEVGADPPDGRGGTEDSPIDCNSGVAGFGTKMVFRTSLRPRRVFERLAGAACFTKSQSVCHQLREAFLQLAMYLRRSPEQHPHRRLPPGWVHF
jgi:hypothetical protein